MDDLMEFTPSQQKRIAELLGVSAEEFGVLAPHLRQAATYYYEMEKRPLPPRQASEILRRFHTHAEGMVAAFKELAGQFRGVRTEWFLKPLERSILRAGGILDALPPRFPKNQPDWQARDLVFELLLIWRQCHKGMPAKGPKAPFTRFVREMFEMLEGKQGRGAPRDARALIGVAIARYQHYYEEPREKGVKLMPGSPELNDYMANKDAEDFFGRVASLIIGQL